jgi:hypothetical protein
MDRRVFLKAAVVGIAVATAGPSGLAATVAVARPARSGPRPATGAVTGPVNGAQVSPLAVSHSGRVYRGTSSGRVETSVDHGATWTLHTNLGPTNPVRSLDVNAGQLIAVVGPSAHAVNLTLGPDGTYWHAAGTAVAASRRS